MKLVICTKFQVNQMNFVESRKGGGPIEPPPPLEASYNYFLFEASRVNNFNSNFVRSALTDIVRDRQLL